MYNLWGANEEVKSDVYDSTCLQVPNEISRGYNSLDDWRHR
jgi:hypothetical protein